MTDITATLQDAVRNAAGNATPLRIIGSDSKAFYGRTTQGQPLQLAAHRGIVEYEPSELVITARAGTPLTEIEAALAEAINSQKKEADGIVMNSSSWVISGKNPV